MAQCTLCNCRFEFNKAKRDLFESKKFPFEPLYCDNCQAEKFNEVWEFSALDRIVICSVCGKEAKLNFKPSNKDSILCKNCYDRKFA